MNDKQFYSNICHSWRSSFKVKYPDKENSKNNIEYVNL